MNQRIEIYNQIMTITSHPPQQKKERKKKEEKDFIYKYKIISNLRTNVFKFK